MEPGQINLIRSNITDLINRTDCNEILLAELERLNILARIDVNEIRYNHPIPESKARKLYEILETRANSFGPLVEALKATRQTGAVNILLQKTSGLPNHGLIEIDENHILGTGVKGNEVYLGTFHHQPVAVKIVRGKEALAEVENLRSMKSHHNIIRYFFAENRNRLTYIALELCEITLAQEIRCKKFNIKPAKILKMCTKGNAFLHRENVIHRDLKPTNVLINHAKQIKISDFGFSVKVDPAASAIEIIDKFGTPHWMAPEVLGPFTNSEPSSTKPKMSRSSDIFSLGCIFFFVLSNGNHPFGSNLANICNRILDSKPDSLPRPLHLHWGSLITSMLQLLPSKRPTAEDIRSGDWFTQKTDSNSVVDGSQPLRKKRIKEYNLEFSTLEPSTINLCQQQKRDSHLIDDRFTRLTAEETWEGKMHETRCSPEASSQFSIAVQGWFQKFKSVLEMCKRLVWPCSKKSSKRLLPDTDSYLYLNVDNDKRKFKEIRKFLSEEQSICVLTLDSIRLDKRTEHFNVSGYSCEYVENCGQLIYVKNSFKRSQIKLPEHLKIKFKEFRYSIFEAFNSGKPKALICTLSLTFKYTRELFLDRFNELCEFLIFGLEIGADERLIIFLNNEWYLEHFESFQQEMRKLGDKYGLVEIAYSKNASGLYYLAFIKTKDRDNVVCKLDDNNISCRKMIIVTYTNCLK